MNSMNKTTDWPPGFTSLRSAATALGVPLYHALPLVSSGVVPALRVGTEWYLDETGTRHLAARVEEIRRSTGRMGLAKNTIGDRVAAMRRGRHGK